jgi:hypothetical protein
MDYGQLFSKALRIMWNHKSLWIFGLFAGSGLGSNFNFSSPGDFSAKDFSGFGGTGFGGDLEQFGDLVVSNLGLLIVAGLLLGVVMTVCHVISLPALIDATNKIARGGRYRFSTSFSAGLDFFWRYLGLFFLGIMSAMVLMAVLVMAGVVSFAIHAALGVLYLLVSIPAGIAGLFTIVLVFGLAQRALVVRDVSIGDSLEEGWTLFRRHLGKAIVFSLLVFAVSIGITIALLIGFVIVGLPFAAFAFTSDASILEILMYGLIIGLPVSLLIGGSSGAFFQILYTLFYFGLVEPARPAVSAQPGATGMSESGGPATFG